MLLASGRQPLRQDAILANSVEAVGGHVHTPTMLPSLLKMKTNDSGRSPSINKSWCLLNSLEALTSSLWRDMFDDQIGQITTILQRCLLWRSLNKERS